MVPEQAACSCHASVCWEKTPTPEPWTRPFRAYLSHATSIFYMYSCSSKHVQAHHAVYMITVSHVMAPVCRSHLVALPWLSSGLATLARHFTV